MTMRVLYDATVFSSQKTGGISRYHYELYKGVRELNCNLKIGGLATKNKYTLADPILRRKLIKDPCAALAGINRFLIKRALRKAGSDVVYHPSNLYRSVLESISKETKVVLTIHDMIIERETNQIDELKKDFALRADKIIAISQATKDEIIDILNIPEEKIEIIYHGSSLNTENIRKPNVALPDKYLLYVGGRRVHKNIPFLLSSISNILKEDKDLHMICAGVKHFSEEEKSHIRNLGIEDKVLSIAKPEDNELAYLYSNALAFVFPSFYEGFGIPILEAWSCKTPLLLSDCTCFKEIGEDAAIYFDPYSEKSIADAVKTIVNDENLRQDLIEKGQERLKLFSWKKTAEETLKVYQSVL